MTIHEFGMDNRDAVVLIHPMGVFWDVFDRVTGPLSKRFHVVVPALPGMDPDAPESDFTSVEAVADELAGWLIERGLEHPACLYGCSLGGGVVARMLACGRVKPRTAIIDGGMTPYQLPKPVTWAIGVRDWCMTELGKHVGVGALRSVFDPEKYGEEDLRYVHRALSHMSARTIWRGFYSANNYAMPSPVPRADCPVAYWYGEQEKRARRWDIEYIREAFPGVSFVEWPGQDHAECFTLHPELFCRAVGDYVGNRE